MLCKVTKPDYNFPCLFCVIMFLGLLVHICFCCVRFSLFITVLRGWHGRSLKWLLFCVLWHVTQSVNHFWCLSTVMHVMSPLCLSSSLLSMLGKGPIYCYCCQATGYASQHIWRLTQSRINWEGCGRKGILHKDGGDDGGGSLISPYGVAPSWIVGVSASVIFPCIV